MNRSHRIPAVPLLCALTLFALGCSAGQSRLEGAVFAGNVPVFTHATFDGQMGGTSYGDTPEETSKGQSWFFTTGEPMEKVMQFYQQKLPGWDRVEDGYGDNPTVTFTRKPEGAGAEEYIQVIISPGKVQIHESFRPSREKS